MFNKEVIVSNSPLCAKLLSKVEQLPVFEVTNELRVQLAIELVKDAVDKGDLKPEIARLFAKSLEENCLVPLYIGIDERKVFPIEAIIGARFLHVENVKRYYSVSGLNYEKEVSERRGLVDKIGLSLHLSSERVRKSYGPFIKHLTPEVEMIEIKNDSRNLLIAKGLLTGQDKLSMTSEQIAVANKFIEIDVANVAFGIDLFRWLEGK